MVEAIKYSASGDKVGTVELPAALFTAEAKNPQALLHEVIKMYLANQRQGTVAKKNRALVQGSGRKLFKQKGTGNARVGNIRTVIRRGGGMAFGIDPKNWYRHIPKRKKRLALKLALTAKAEAGNVFIVQDLSYNEPSTKDAESFLSKVRPTEWDRVLLVTDGNDKAVVRSFTNITRVEGDRADGLYAYEILKAKLLVITESALKKMVEVFA
ncbi:MAG: 50S ribosomal protein L4 [Candidatus Zophobacter franzmannii]|jgi:large subunit ribosomal protein L4|nr:50S ribosomal protein L4 [Candidatus Zophobacter franzmannii]